MASKYDTPLRRKIYEATDEYQKKYKDLTDVKLAILAKKFYINVEPYSDFYWKFSEYNLERQGFYLKRETGVESLYVYNVGEIKSAIFEALPIELGKYTFFGKDFLVERLFIPVDEKVAPSVENNDDIGVLISFPVTKAKEYRNVIAGCPAEAFVFSKKSGEIYANKVYDCPPKTQPIRTEKKPTKKKKNPKKEA